MTLLDCVIRLSFAFILGTSIGLERQWRHRNASLRTDTLVATGSALFVMLSMLTTSDSSPTRISAQVVSGIGFLGAGVIIRDGLNIRGLNTAATLWCSAAIGTLTGSGFLIESVLGTIAILLTNILLRPLSLRINRTLRTSTEEETRYCLEVICQAENKANVRTLLFHIISNEKLTLSSLNSKDLPGNVTASIEAQLTNTGHCDTTVEKIVSQLSREPGVSFASWKSTPSVDD